LLAVGQFRVVRAQSGRNPAMPRQRWPCPPLARGLNSRKYVVPKEHAMRERIKEDTKTAMKAGDKTRTGVLRLVSAAFQSAEIETKGPLSAAAELAVMTKMVKQRRDSIAQFTSGGRPDLAAIEEAEITIIEAYLPKQMSEADAKTAIGAVMKELGAAGPKDMGKVMGALKERYAGQMDFGAASGWIKELLR
jgi:uncharacterized protein